MDVKSLYTVIPSDEGLQALAYFLEQRTAKVPSTHALVHLAELVLTLNAFSFDDQHYRQIGGVAMGSKMGPNYASVCQIRRRTDPLRVHRLCTSITQAFHW